MKQPRKTDSQIVGHARRELEMAGLFTVNKENDYDGFIGKGVLAMVKLFDEWTGDNPQKMQAIQSVFNYVIAGDLLSPPTNDPDEWEDFDIDGQTVRRNKRNIMYITRDDGRTWHNLRTEAKGICNDHNTGKPVEGVEDPNGNKPEANDQESTADASDSGDGKDAELAATDSQDAGAAEGSQGVEASEQHAGVEPEGKQDQSQPEKAKAKSKKREA